MTLYLSVGFQFRKNVVPTFLQRSILTLMSMYQLLSLHLSSIQGMTSKDPLYYVDATLQEATHDAFVMHLGVNDM